jgi:hypothetical protein
MVPMIGRLRNSLVVIEDDAAQTLARVNDVVTGLEATLSETLGGVVGDARRITARADDVLAMAHATLDAARRDANRAMLAWEVAGWATLAVVLIYAYRGLRP